MQVVYTGEQAFNSCGQEFTKGESYEITDKDYKYLTETFGQVFEEVKTAKALKVEVKDGKGE